MRTIRADGAGGIRPRLEKNDCGNPRIHFFSKPSQDIVLMNEHLQLNDEKDLVVGLSGLGLDQVLELGNGVMIRPTFAHVFSTDILAFERPAAPHSFHPGPWQANSRRAGIDITAELFIPKSHHHRKASPIRTARTIATLLRIWTDPQICIQILTDRPISELKLTKYSGPQDEHVAHLTGDRNRHVDFFRPNNEGVIESLTWVSSHWEDAVDLRCSSPEFEFALETFDNAQLIPNTAMMLVSIWGALEAIFASANAELRFRVSANIAAFLAPRGPSRLEKQREVMKLYDARSSAAHGNPKHGPEEVLQSFQLLRHAIIRMVENKAVPSKKRLEELLFSS